MYMYMQGSKVCTFMLMVFLCTYVVLCTNVVVCQQNNRCKLSYIFLLFQFLCLVHVGVPVEPNLKVDFEEFSQTYSRTIYKVIAPIFKKIGSTELENYLNFVCQDTETRLEAGKEVLLLSTIVRKNCTFPFIGLLRKLAKDFAEDLPEVQELLAKFDEERKQFLNCASLESFLAKVKDNQTQLGAKVNFI